MDPPYGSDVHLTYSRPEAGSFWTRRNRTTKSTKATKPTKIRKAKFIFVSFVIFVIFVSFVAMTPRERAPFLTQTTSSNTWISD